MKTDLTFLIILALAMSCKENSDSISRTLAYVNIENGVHHIFLMELDKNAHGINQRRLTTNSEGENYPNWAPNGTKIVFQLDRDGAGIYIVNTDGTNLTRLSPTPGYDVTPSWSPDGRQIIYTRLLSNISQNQYPLTEIHIMDSDGSNDHLIFSDSSFSVEPRWSVKDKIVFMQNQSGSLQIMTIDIDGSNLQQLTAAGNNGDPTWSHDGSSISFGSDREGSNKLNIYRMANDGSNVVQLTHLDVPYEAGDTNWSADDQNIVYEWDINGKKQSDSTAYAEVWVVRSDGSAPASTLQPCSDVGCAPRWKP